MMMPVSLSFPTELGTLFWLAAVRSPPFLFLVSSHARSQRKVDPWRYVEAKAFGKLVVVELVHIEDGSKAVTGIRLKVGPVAVLG